MVEPWYNGHTSEYMHRTHGPLPGNPVGFVCSGPIVAQLPRICVTSAAARIVLQEESVRAMTHPCALCYHRPQGRAAPAPPAAHPLRVPVSASST
jgi:hypothetical protein